MGETALITFALVVGGAVFLLVEHPFIFWLVLVPLVVMFFLWLFKN